MADFDLAVIGAGASGLAVTSVAARLGLSVALIEHGRMGGDCLNFGCVPSKALLAAAHAAQSARRAGRYGVRLPEPEIEWQAVRDHVQAAIAAIAPTDSEERYRSLGATVLRDTARFVAPDALMVGGRRLTARRIVIAAGSHAAVPDIPGLRDVPFLTNETLFDIAEKPEPPADPGRRTDWARDGAGPCRARLPGDGGAVRQHRRQGGSRAGGTAARHPGRSGCRNRRARGGRRRGAGAGARAEGRQAHRGHAPAGRGRPAAQPRRSRPRRRRACAPHASGVATDRGLRSTTNRRVYAVGDIADPEGIGPRAFTHVGSYHAGIVIRRALFRLPARIDYSALPRVTYTDPELAQVGLTEAEARKAGHDVTRASLAARRERSGDRRGGHRRAGEAGGGARPRAGRGHPGAARGGDDRHLDPGDRPPGASFRRWPA